jgi:hypothetical protein
MVGVLGAPRTTIEAAVDLARAGASERLRSLADLVVRCAIGSAAPFRTGWGATSDVPSRATLERGRPHLSTSSGSISATDPSPRIRVACTGCGLVSAPVIRACLDGCVSAIREVAPANGVGQVSHGTWVEVYCYSKSWPCLFPQHGPGKKHQRRIVLTDWQTTPADRWPEQLARGLIHSGRVPLSEQRRELVMAALQLHAGVRQHPVDLVRRVQPARVHRTKARTTIYVSRKADVAVLDGFIGRKR